MLFVFFLCTIINIVGIVHFKNTKVTIIGIMWQFLLIIQLTMYLVKKNHDTKNDDTKNDDTKNFVFEWKLKNLHMI